MGRQCGPRELRPKRLDLAWRTIETNQFGIAEFHDWCQQANTAYMMAINLDQEGLKTLAIYWNTAMTILALLGRLAQTAWLRNRSIFGCGVWATRWMVLGRCTKQPTNMAVWQTRLLRPMEI